MVSLAEAAFEYAPYPMAVLDRTGSVVRHNSAMSQFLNIENAAPTGKMLTALWTGPDPEGLADFLQNLTVQNDDSLLTWATRTNSGPGTAISLTGRVIDDGAGRNLYLISVDPTAPPGNQNRAQSAGQTDAAIPLRTATDIGFWYIDLKTGEGGWSQREMQLLGYTEEDYEDFSEHRLDVVHPDDRDRMFKAIETAAETGETGEIVLRIRDARGKYRSIHHSFKMVFDDAGEPLRLVGTEHDLTELLDVQDRLIRAESVAGIGTWEVSLKTGEIYWSPGVYRLHNFDPETFQPTQENIASVFHEDDRQLFLNARQRMMVDGRLNKGDHDVVRLRILQADGSFRHAELNSAHILDDQGEAIGLMGTMHDIDDLVKTQAQLLQAQKMEIVGKFSGGVAHDFNNLLAVIVGNLELIQDSEDRQEIEECIESALAASKQASDLTRKLLSFARKATLEPQSTDLNGLIGDMKSMLERVLPDRIDLSTSLDDALWPVHIDRSSFESAVLNLVINARDAIGDRGAITIETGNKVLTEVDIDGGLDHLHPGPYVVVSVSDSGEGIPPEVMSEIFTPFFSTKPMHQGSGLGLSMVQGFAEQSQGGVRVYSEPGNGTSIKLFFPASVKDTSIMKMAQAGLNGFQIEGRVLLAEDNPSLSQLLQQNLHGFGLDCIAASSGDEALQLYNLHGPFDLLLTDIVMPGTLRGAALAQRLRQFQPDLKVIFISGFPNEAALHGNVILPEAIRLMKTIHKNYLNRTVQRACDMNRHH